MLASVTLAAVMVSSVATSRGDQPLTVYSPAPSDRPVARPLVLVLSGEGGWRAFDIQLAKWLSDDGYWVGGIDCMKYFWKPQDDRAQLAKDVSSFAAALKRTSHAAAGTRVILAGFSFGADLAPWIAGAAPPELPVASLLMIGPDLTGSLEARVTEILGFKPSGHTFDTAKALAESRAVPVLFVHGGKDDNSSAPQLHQAFAGPKRLAVIAGATHHFAGHEQELRTAILDGLRQLPKP